MCAVITIDKTDSTNLEILRRLPDDISSGDMLVCREQTAGRGQRGNSWEAKPGLNLTCSLLFIPDNLLASRQFEISMAVSLGVVDFISRLAALDRDVCVKWPNDIYVGDRKICGILIENALQGQYISRSIIGIGLNVNQTLFLSDAPNPVSLAMLTGRVFDIPEAACLLSDLINIRLKEISSVPFSKRLTEYFSKLWRREGFHPYVITRDNTPVSAKIISIAPDGIITVLSEDGRAMSFAFKEIKAVIGNNIL